MQMLRNKTKIVIALFLVLSFAVSLFAILPTTGAITKVPDRDTGAYISVNPDLIGINQPLTVNMWVYPPPQGPQYEMGGTYQMYFHNITATFTRPDGSKDTFMPLDGSASDALKLKPGMTEEVGTMWFLYKPNQLGTWSVSFSFPGETYTMLNQSVYYKPSTSQTISFEVQQDNVQIGLPPVQLPTGYWERPITAENREWSQISGAWGFGDKYSSYYFNPYSEAPNSAHIVWKNEVSLGGLVGGDYGGLSFAGGGGSPAIIFSGRVYYNKPTATGTQMQCVDLRTGELIWQTLGSISAGQIASPTATSVSEFYGSPVPYLWEYGTTAWKRYDAFSGSLLLTLSRTLTGGSPVWLDDNIAYIVRQGTWNATSLRRPYNELIKWNLSKSGSTWDSKIEWRISMKQPDGTGPGEGSRGSSISLLSDLGIGVVNTVGEDKFYAYNLDTGAQEWVRSVGFPAQVPRFTPEGYLQVYDTSSLMLTSYDVRTWNKMWSVKVGEYPWGSQGYPKAWAYGNTYFNSYDGYQICIDSATGNIEWKTYVGNTTELPWGTWAIRGALVADGKVYGATSEHTPTQPIPRGNKLFCMDALTGETIWNISLSGGVGFPRSVAEGYLLSTNEYDGLLYCFGKGKTETSVSVATDVIAEGSSVLVKGSVLDMSPASKGTPAISDEDMSAWMNYLYMGRSEPMASPDGDSWGTAVDVKGVEVSLDTIDPNGNFIHIGTVTSDSSGMFKKLWTPEVPGEYTVIATFAGSESYWASYAETAVGVVEAPAVTPAEEQVPTDFTPMYTALAGGVIAIIIAIAIAVVLLLRKR